MRYFYHDTTAATIHVLPEKAEGFGDYLGSLEHEAPTRRILMATIHLLLTRYHITITGQTVKEHDSVPDLSVKPTNE